MRCFSRHRVPSQRGLLPNSTAVSLLEHITHLNKLDRENQAIHERTEALRQERRNAGGHCAVVEFLLPYLTPYAVRLLLEQEKQANYYWATPVDDDATPIEEEDLDSSAYVLSYVLGHFGDDEKPYRVRRRAAAPSNAETPTYNNDGKISSYISDADYGCKSCDDCGQLGRLCTYFNCSCQFPKSYKGLLCRHCISACQAGQVEEIPLHLISARWLKADVSILRRRYLLSKCT